MTVARLHALLDAYGADPALADRRAGGRAHHRRGPRARQGGAPGTRTGVDRADRGARRGARRRALPAVVARVLGAAPVAGGSDQHIVAVAAPLAAAGLVLWLVRASPAPPRSRRPDRRARRLRPTDASSYRSRATSTTRRRSVLAGRAQLPRRRPAETQSSRDRGMRA
jgi:hypothetical protein